MGQINLTEINYESSTSEKLFVLFLFVAVCIILVRMTRLAWCLWSLRTRQEFSSFGTSDAESIAKAALRGLFKREPTVSDRESIFKVDCIETRFLYLWETCQAKVQSTKTLAGLTFILSFSVAALGCFNICTGLKTEESAGIAAVAGAGQEIFMLLTIGLCVSAFFYALSLLFEVTLARRRRDWSYLRARIREGFSSKQQQYDGSPR